MSDLIQFLQNDIIEKRLLINQLSEELKAAHEFSKKLIACNSDKIKGNCRDCKLIVHCAAHSTSCIPGNTLLTYCSNWESK